MKVLFAGPSLHGQFGELRSRFPDLEIRGPACLGDVAASVFDGAEAIGLIDGCFGDTPAVWHKEILHALEKGVPVAGGASMGALRAAECSSLGMAGIGSIFEDYHAGRILDDEAVALAHGPGELDWMPLSVPWVNFEATVRKASLERGITSAEAGCIMLAGRHLHYAVRTFKAAVGMCTVADGKRRDVVLRTLATCFVDRKRQDAWKVVDWLKNVQTPSVRPSWTLSRTSQWLGLANGLIGTSAETAGGDRLHA